MALTIASQWTTEVKILTLLINLDRSVERLAAVDDQFRRAGWPYERFRAIEPEVVENHPELDHRRFLRLHNRSIRRGELGCALSHKRCLEQFLATDEAYLVVFEDDVCLDERTFPTVLKTLEWLEMHCNADWHCINLSSGYAKRCRDLTMIEGRILRRSWQFPLLTSALLWNRKGAAAFLAHLNKGLIHTTVDNQLRAFLGRIGQGLSFDTPPVGLTQGPSEINPEGTRKKTTRNGWHDLKRRLPIYAWALWHQYRR